MKAAQLTAGPTSCSHQTPCNYCQSGIGVDANGVAQLYFTGAVSFATDDGMYPTAWLECAQQSTVVGLPHVNELTLSGGHGTTAWRTPAAQRD